METFPIQAVYIYWFIFFFKEHSFSIEKVPVSCDYPMLIINVFNFLWRNLESPWFIVDLSEESKTNLGNSSIKKLTHFAVTRHESFWANPLLIAVSPSPKAYLTQITHTMEIVVILCPYWSDIMKTITNEAMFTRCQSQLPIVLKIQDFSFYRPTKIANLLIRLCSRNTSQRTVQTSVFFNYFHFALEIIS